MVGTNHVSVEDVQIDKACVFQQQNNKIVIFQSLFSNKTKEFSWTKDTGLSNLWFQGNEWNFEGVNTEAELVNIMLWGNNANNRRGKRSKSQKVGAAAAAAAALWL